MKKYFSIILFLVMLVGVTQSVFAKRFASQFCEFELPPGWVCALEGSEWVCQSVDKNRKKEAIIILAAKLRGKLDALDQYKAYLNKPKSFNLPGGKVQVSEAKYAKYKELNQHRWVDSLHLASEVPGFYTRYLATVKEDLGVAVTFSVSKNHYSSYQEVFEKVVGTLRVFRQKGAQAGNFKLKKKDENLLAGSTFIPSDSKAYDIGQKKRKSNSLMGSSSSSLILILLVVGVILVIIRSRKKKKKK